MNQKCYNHPDNDARFICEQCGFLCTQEEDKEGHNAVPITPEMAEYIQLVQNYRQCEIEKALYEQFQKDVTAYIGEEGKKVMEELDNTNQKIKELEEAQPEMLDPQYKEAIQKEMDNVVPQDDQLEQIKNGILKVLQSSAEIVNEMNIPIHLESEPEEQENDNDTSNANNGTN